MAKYNFAELKADCDIVALIERFGVKLKQEPGSPHYKGLCPFHNETTSSFTVTPKKHYWTCFGCGAKGDVFDFLQRLNYTLDEAVNIVKGEVPGNIAPMPERRIIEREVSLWKQATPDRWPSNFVHERYGSPVATWPYHNKDGVIISYDCRFEWFDEEAQKLRKDVLPITFMTDGTRSEWRWHGMDVKRTLSNLHLLLADTSRAVLIVEGKKTAAAAEQLVVKPCVTTWQGGSNAIQQTDWSPLFGRDVIIWQDNDYPGYKAASEIADILKPHCKVIKFVHNPEGCVKGWDAADALADGWTKEMTRKFILMYKDDPQVIIDPKIKENEEASIAGDGLPVANIQQPAENIENAQGDKQVEIQEQPFQVHEHIGDPADDAHLQYQQEAYIADQDEPVYGRNQHFKFLGFESKDGKLLHCFYALDKKVVIKLSASAIGKAAPLLELAPLEYWEREFPKSGNGVFDIVAAANFLISISGKLPIYRGANIRGRGVWMDGKKIVVHNGDHLIVDGRPCNLGSLNSEYIYEQNSSFGLDASSPLGNHESYKFLELCNDMRWDRNVNGYLLAGWCVIAPVCGSLTWRPHIWITGGSGSGKTWVLNNIIKPTLGKISLRVQGSTSEAGIRQRLRQDARPVVFDEAEGESQKDAERMQSVITLMRAASSEDGGDIVKGSAGGGGAENYQIRSCFAYASIGMQISQQADRTRVTILGMKSHGETDAEKKLAAEHFATLKRKQFNLITDEYTQRLQARTIHLLPIILKNAETFSAAAATVLGTQRGGDQLGALLAGAYSLRSNGLISLQEAEKWVIDKDWSEERALTETRDEHNVFAHIMEQTLRVEGVNVSWDRSVGELVRLVQEIETPEQQNSISKYSARQRLSRAGILIEHEDGKDWILISNTDYSIKRLLQNTPWSKNHANLLVRIPGAKKHDTKRFGSGMNSRATAIPMDYFTG